MINSLLTNSNILVIIIIFGISLYILSKAADVLVDNAIKLSLIFGISEIVIGATVVSLGTTIPELSASVTSSMQGNGAFAIGNAIGSIITNTCLVLGIGALYMKIPLDKKSSQKFNLLIIAVLIIIVPTMRYIISGDVIQLSQYLGFVLLALIPAYILFLVIQEKKRKAKIEEIEEIKAEKPRKRDTLIIVLKLIIAAVFVAISASLLVGSAENLAIKIGIPDVIIASTLVAFGTSIPELSTCIAAVKKKRGGLAMGNIMGANILNIIMVIGAAASVSKGGITISQAFYNVNFIPLVIILIIFGFFAHNNKTDNIDKKEGKVLLIVYASYIIANLISAI